MLSILGIVCGLWGSDKPSARFFPSSSPTVIMMQATQNRPPDHLTPLVFRQAGNAGWVGNLLIKALMRTCLIEELTVLADNAPGMLFTQNQNMVQTSTADAADDPFADRIGLGRIGRRVDEFDASAFYRMFKTRPILVVVVAN
jgi:hypothetical protein